MRVWDVSIRNPVFISMIMLALVVLGVMAYTSMPLDFFPDVSFPTMAVITVYPGAGPGEVENQVTKPIEEAMVTAPGVEEVQSRSYEGYAIVVVSFNLDKDDKVALQEVREKIANVRSDLPDGVLEPTVMAYDPSSLPILRISVGHSSAAGSERPTWANLWLARPSPTISCPGCSASTAWRMRSSPGAASGRSRSFWMPTRLGRAALHRSR